MRLLLAAIIMLLGIAAAQAADRGDASDCGPYVDGNTVGDTICPEVAAKALCSGKYANGQPCFGLYDIPYFFKPGSALLWPFHVGAIKAELCAGRLGWVSAPINGHNLNYAFAQYQVYAQTPRLCDPPSTAFFRNTSTAKGYYTSASACAALANGQVLEFKAPPAGIPFWADNCAVTANDVSIRFDAGFRNCCSFAPSPPGQASYIIEGNKVTLDGGAFEHGATVRVEDGAADPTLTHMTIEDSAGTSQTSCILSGRRNRTVTLTGVTVHGCGAGGAGQNHNIYVSADVAGDATAAVQIADSRSYDVQGGGWTLKLRPECVSAQCRVTTSFVGCQSTGRGCQQNGVVDMPCGGNYAIDHSELERGPGGDNWYMLRMLEEPVGPALCAPRAAVNNLTLDHDSIIWDGPVTGARVISIVCLAGHDGDGNCAKSGVPSGTTCTVANSVIVSDSATGVSLVLGGGCRDGGGNRTYPNRSAAAAGEHWSGKDMFGNPCCAFPWVPPRS